MASTSRWSRSAGVGCTYGRPSQPNPLAWAPSGGLGTSEPGVWGASLVDNARLLAVAAGNWGAPHAPQRRPRSRSPRQLRLASSLDCRTGTPARGSSCSSVLQPLLPGARGRASSAGQRWLAPVRRREHSAGRRRLRGLGLGLGPRRCP
jgi:hypothetical protein